jgi:hypothetical protein
MLGVGTVVIGVNDLHRAVANRFCVIDTSQ